MNKKEIVVRGFIVVTIVGTVLLLPVIFYGTVVYTAIHFIRKFW